MGRFLLANILAAGAGVYVFILGDSLSRGWYGWSAMSAALLVAWLVWWFLLVFMCRAKDSGV